MLNTIKINMFLIGVILLIFGVAMLITALVAFIYSRKLRKKYDIQSKAKIVRFTKQIGKNCSMPIYELIYDDTSYELRSNMGASEYNYKAGDIVKIWFDSENPFHFISEVELSLYGRLNLMFRTLGIFAILPGILSVIISLILGIFTK